MTKPVQDIDRGWKAIMKEMRAIKSLDYVIDVGITGAEAEEEHKEEGGHVFGKASIGFQKTKLTNVMVGTFHEFGTTGVSLGRSGATSGGVPERSFIRSTMDEKHAQIGALLAKVAGLMIDRSLKWKQGAGLVGEKAVSWIKAKIRKGIPPPLMPSTIDSKGSSKPLIDTGQLMGSITYAIRKSGEGAK